MLSRRVVMRCVVVRRIVMRCDALSCDAEFGTPERLAEYVLEIEASPSLYDSFFEWRKDGFAESPLEARVLPDSIFCEGCRRVHHAYSGCQFANFSSGDGA